MNVNVGMNGKVEMIQRTERQMEMGEEQPIGEVVRQSENLANALWTKETDMQGVFNVKMILCSGGKYTKL